MPEVRGYATKSATSLLEPFLVPRRDVGSRDVRIEIQYCGVCHSDIHQARDEWGGSIFPMVPGHEIVGRVAEVGREVTRFATGDLVGVGCMVDSCRNCDGCHDGVEQFCVAPVFTYNARDKSGEPTYGGYSQGIVVDENYVLKVPQNLDSSRVAPLLCAGITTYSPMRTWGVKKGQRVAVVGLGGLGHMAVKFAVSFGAEVTVLSTSRAKEEDARKLGAHHFIATKEANALDGKGSSFDYLIDTVSAPHDINALVGLLKRDGTMTIVGVPPGMMEVSAFPLIMGRRRLTGSLIGGIRETQEMLDYCGQHGVMSDVEVIAAKDINGAYERMLKGNVRYRFVIDCATL